MVQIRRLLVLILFVICCGLLSEAAAGDNKGYKCENNTYTSTGRVNAASTPQATPYSWTDSKGNKYPIYISNSGSCFIIKHRKSDNKEYRDYLGEEISRDICKKLGKEYKGKKK